jgi:hypothetical protein
MLASHRTFWGDQNRGRPNRFGLERVARLDDDAKRGQKFHFSGPLPVALRTGTDPQRPFNAHGTARPCWPHSLTGITVHGRPGGRSGTALHIAAEEDAAEVALILIAAGAPLEARNASGKTPADVKPGSQWSRRIGVGGCS